MNATMIRSLLICSALVASSGAGAVALSALHDATGDQQVRTLAPAPAPISEARFVIPTFAPAAKAPEVANVALRDAPALPQIETSDVAPAPVASTVVAAATPDISDLIVKRQTAPVVTPEPRATPKAVQAARAVRTQTVRTYEERSTRPVIVAQAPAFTAAQTATLQPDYVIGVYR